MSTHTPGPWKAFNSDYAIGVTGSKDTDVAHCRDKYGYPLDSGRSWEEDLANAYLMAAAPDMYEALKRIANMQPRLMRSGGVDVHDRRSAQLVARRAIAKAEGKA